MVDLKKPNHKTQFSNLNPCHELIKNRSVYKPTPQLSIKKISENLGLYTRTYGRFLYICEEDIIFHSAKSKEQEHKVNPVMIDKIPCQKSLFQQSFVVNKQMIYAKKKTGKNLVTTSELLFLDNPIKVI